MDLKRSTRKGEYWRKISKGIFDYLLVLGLNPSEIYLVGSCANELSTPISLGNDIDSVILIRDQLPLKSLKKLRLIIWNYLLKIDHANLYHFKLFNEDEFKLLGKYDGFRLLEFQIANIPMCSGDKIESYTPVLDLSNFVNSILIQLVYEFTKVDVGTSLDDLLTNKVKNRIERNKDIWESKGVRFNLSSGDTIAFCSECDWLFNLFWGIVNNGHNRELTLKFMDLYFKRFRHEYINKYYEYLMGISVPPKHKRESKKPFYSLSLHGDKL